MPDEKPARFQYARELSHDPRIVGRVREEAKGREQVEHRVEPRLPAQRQSAHVSSSVAEIPTGTALSRHSQQIARVVQTVNVVPGFGEQVGMAALTARNVENAGADRQRQHVHQSRYFVSVAFGSKERFVLEEVVRVERPLPPLLALFQKNTGSR